MLGVEVSELSPNPPPTQGAQTGLLSGAGNVSIVGGTFTNVETPNHSPVQNDLEFASARPAESLSSSSLTELPTQRYSRLLMQAGRGYPLMDPALASALPAEYQCHGVMIGDVGIVSQHGYFDVLFNICEPANGSINGDVPEGFVPLQKPPNNRHNYERRPANENGDYEVCDSQIQVISPLQGAFNPDEYIYKFQRSSAEGAILVLPLGASREDLLCHENFRDYAVKHGVSWYAFVGRTLGRTPYNGSIYLITGYDKARSWGTASFPTGPTLAGPICFTQVGWDSYGSASVKKGSSIAVDEVLPENQTIFLRGYKVTLSEKMLARIFGIQIVETSPLGEVPFHHSRSSSFRLSNTKELVRNPFKSMIQKSGNQAKLAELENVLVNEAIVTPTTSPLHPEIHPSNIVNLYLLEKFPDSDLAITHDSVWCSYYGVKPDLTHGNHVLTPFFEYIDKSYTMIQDNGGIYFTNYSEENMVESPLDSISSKGSVQSRHDAVVKAWLDALGIDRSDGTPIHQASKNGCLDIVKILCEQGADINAKDYESYTALHLASEYGHLEIVKILCEQGADINANDYENYTALHLASEHGHLKVVKVLCEQGANINAKACYYETALHIASRHGHSDIVKVLCEQGADINAKTSSNQTALYLASRYGHLDIVEILCKQGVDINAKGKNNNTALHVASKHGHLDIVKMLCDQGADIDATAMYNKTPLHMASEHGKTDIVKILCCQGVDMNEKGSSNDTAHYLASDFGHLDTGKSLCRQGADVNKRNSCDYNALHLASKHGHLEIVKILCAQGADMDARGLLDQTALHLASEHGHLDVVNILCEQGADINAMDYENYTALHLASRHGHLDIVKILCKQGTDVNTRTRRGASALDFAREYQHQDIVEFLSGKESHTW